MAPAASDPYAVYGITAQPADYDIQLSSQDVLALTNDAVMKEVGAYTRPFLSSTRAVSVPRKHPTHPKHPLTPP